MDVACERSRLLLPAIAAPYLCSVRLLNAAQQRVDFTLMLSSILSAVHRSFDPGAWFQEGLPLSTHACRRQVHQCGCLPLPTTGS